MTKHNDIARTRRRIGRKLSHARIDVNGAVEDATADATSTIRDASGQVSDNATQAAANAKALVQSRLPAAPLRSLAIGAAVAAVAIAALTSVFARRRKSPTTGGE
jgi:hypothetical protein